MDLTLFLTLIINGLLSDINLVIDVTVANPILTDWWLEITKFNCQGIGSFLLISLLSSSSASSGITL